MPKAKLEAENSKPLEIIEKEAPVDPLAKFVNDKNKLALEKDRRKWILAEIAVQSANGVIPNELTHAAEQLDIKLIWKITSQGCLA